MDFKTLKNLVDCYVVNKFHKITALLVIFFVSFFVMLFIHGNIRNDFNYEWYLYTLIFFIELLIWVYYRFRPLPKNKIKQNNGRRKIGLVIAIFSEDYEGEKIKKKFIKELDRQINEKGLGDYINLIELPNHRVEKIKKPKDIESVHVRVGGDIYFYGDVQKAKDGDGYKYFLNIDGYVKHLPVPIQVSKELSFDFRTVLPKEIQFSEFFEMRGCKATAKIMYLTTKYVVGIVALISGDPLFAYAAHKDLVTEMENYKKIDQDRNLSGISEFDFKKLKAIEKKLPLIISNEAYLISRIHCINKNKNEALNYLRIAEQNNPRSYPVSLTKSVYEFLYNSNVEASFSAIKQAKRLSIKGQLEWRYNWAFLKFWNGEYKDAYAMCRKINNQRYEREDSTLDEVEVFNRDLLKKEPEKTQLYFWIGYLAYKKRGDILKAKSLFDQYLSQTNGKAQEYLVMLAKSFLSEINNKSNLGNS